MGVLLYICFMFVVHLYWRTPLLVDVLRNFNAYTTSPTETASVKTAHLLLCSRIDLGKNDNSTYFSTCLLCISRTITIYMKDFVQNFHFNILKLKHVLFWSFIMVHGVLADTLFWCITLNLAESCENWSMLNWFTFHGAGGGSKIADYIAFKDFPACWHGGVNLRSWMPIFI